MKNSNSKKIEIWSVNRLVKYAFIGFVELRNVFLLIAFFIIYFSLVLSLFNNISLGQSLSNYLLWFFGYSKFFNEDLIGLTLFYISAKILGYFFLGLLFFIVTKSTIFLWDEMQKKNPYNPSIGHIVGILLNLNNIFKTCINMKNNWKKLLVGFLVLAIPLIWGACQNTGKKEKEATLKAVELPITYSAITHIAKSKGYIAEEKLNYQVISVPAGPDIINGLRGGGENAADVGSIAVTPVIVMIGAGDHPVVLATGIESNVRVKLITFPENGITDDPITLKGKKIGYVGSTVGEIYLSRLLKKVGMNEKDIIPVNGRPADIKNLFLRGDLDAAILWDPFISQSIRQSKELSKNTEYGTRGVPKVYVDSTLYRLTFNIVTTKDKLKEKRKELVEFLSACIKAGNFITENPGEAQKILEDWLNLEAGDLTDFIQTTSFDVHLDVPQMKKDMKEELEWLKERQPSTIIPDDLSRFIDVSLLQEISPELVSKD